MSDLIAGALEITTNGKTVNAVGNFTLNLGRKKRDFLVGPDRVHGYSEKPQAPSIVGEIRDSDSLNVVNDILDLKDATVVAFVANSKKYMFEKATYTGDGNIETEEGKVQFQCGAMSATEVK
jgi:hypothetical protein